VVNVVEDKVALVDLEDLEDREVSVVVVSKVDLVEVVRTAVERLVNPSLAVLSKEDLVRGDLAKADLEVNEAVVKVASVVKADLVVSEVVGLVALVVPVKVALVWILKWDGRWMSLSKRFSTRHSTRGLSKLNFRFLVRWESLAPKLLRHLV
jgi:hypothetical protein